MKQTILIRALPASLAICVAFSLFACGDRVDNNISVNITGDAATDTAAPDTGLGEDSTSDASPDAAAPVLCATEGGFGCACGSNNDCNSSRCIEGRDGRMCTQECIESCPVGFDCTTVGGPGDGASICVPRHVSLCRPCKANADCRLGGDTSAQCIAAANPDEGSFCATSCASLACPEAYSCEDMSTGQGDATAKLCVPADDALCECRPSWQDLGLETQCFNSNELGSCAGTRSCGADGLGACGALAATTEVCDNIDNDCNGGTDDIAATACEISTANILTSCPGVTACADGALTCSGRAPSAEICDGVDNDCDTVMDDSSSNCLDSGCVGVAATAGFVQNGAPSCFEGGCVYANPQPCGYFSCVGGGSVGDVCATTCSDDSECITNATCTSGACRCVVGYAGATCQLCATGYQDKDRDGTCLPSCAITACVQGICADGGGTAICTCNEGHIGAACDTCDSPDYTDPDDDGLCVIRGDVLLGAAPGTVARVAKVYRFVMHASQEGFMPGDAFVYSLTTAPATMTINAVTGEIAWTPSADEQTWDEDPTLSTTFDLTIRATAPDGQYAEHMVAVQVLPQVFVEGLFPAAGSARGGEAVLIFGSGFVEPAGLTGTIGFTFGAVAATSVTIVDQNTLAIVTPPAFALTRPATVVLDGDPEASLKPGYTHLPSLAFASTTELTIGSNITLSGAGFDPANATATAAEFPSLGRSHRIVRVSALPDGAEATFAIGVGSADSTFGTGAIHAIVNGLKSNALPLTVTDSPLTPRLTVTSVASPAAPGGTMVLRGAGLNAGGLGIAFSSTGGPIAATVVTANIAGTEVSVTVPMAAKTGPVFLTAPDRVSATSHVLVALTGTTPALFVASATPEIVAPGDAVVIDGQGFVDPIVTIGGIPARILSTQPMRIVVELPPTLTLGPARILVTTAETSAEGPILGVTGRIIEHIAGSPPSSAPENSSPTGSPLSAAFTTHPSGLHIAHDRIRIRAYNPTAAAVTAFGVTVPPGTMLTLAPITAESFAVRPLGGDVFFVSGNTIKRLRQSDGLVLDYAGQTAAGNAGNDGHRLDASFSSPRNLAFTQNNVLVIADYFNGPIRAINTAGSATSRWGITLPPDIVKSVEVFGPQSLLGLAVDRDDSIIMSGFTQIHRIASDRLPPSDPAHVGRELIAGKGGSVPTTGCPATGVVLGTNHGVSVDPTTGDVYVGSRHGVLRRIVASGGTHPTRVDGSDCVEDFAGLSLPADGVPRPGQTGDGGPATTARVALLPQPHVAQDGTVYVLGNGFVRTVTPSPTPSERIIRTIAGRAPLSVDDLDARAMGEVSFSSNLVVDTTRNRWLMGFDTQRIIAVDRDTFNSTLIAGTGLAGSYIPESAEAQLADLSITRGIALGDNRHLIVLEALMPRISSVDLETGLIRVVAGIGRASTGAEDLFRGPAANAPININTGRPKVTVGADGLIYFANNNIVRVINPTQAPVTTFGITIPTGHIDYLPTGLGANVTRAILDPHGTLWVASLTRNRLAVLRPGAPTVAERIIPSDAGVYGRMGAGRLGDLRIAGILDLAFLPTGDLLIVPYNENSLYFAKAHANGTVNAESLCAPIFGIGAPGSFVADRPASAQSLGITSVSVDGDALIVNVGGRIIRLTL